MDLIKVAWGMGIRSDPWRAGFLWLGWGVLGGLLPLWGTAILLLLFDRSISLFELLKNGEFVLYAASFVGGSMFTIRRDVFPSKNSLTILFVLLVGISALVFAAITVTALGKVSDQSVNWLRISEHALTRMSVFVFVLTTLVCFVVTVVDSGGGGIDIPAELKKEPERLEAEFDRIQKENLPPTHNENPPTKEARTNGDAK